MGHRTLIAAAMTGCIAVLSGCVEDTGATGTPSAGEQACLQRTSIETNNGDVVLLSSRQVRGATEVIVGVGPQQARWRCYAYEGGGTSRPLSLTNEGTL